MKLHHPAQQHILQHLLFAPGSRFRDIRPENMDTSRFTFHLDQLVQQGLVAKEQEGGYRLTRIGKEEANRYDPGADTPRTQSKMSAVFCCRNTTTGEFLLYERLKEPYFHCFGFPTGKVRLGESFCTAAERELLEETGLTGRAQLLGIHHVMVRSQDDNMLLEDKTMAICLVEDPTGNLTETMEGSFFWVAPERIPRGPLLPETPLILQVLRSEELPHEHTLTTSHY